MIHRIARNTFNPKIATKDQESDCCSVHVFASSDVPTSASVFCLPQEVGDGLRLWQLLSLNGLRNPFETRFLGPCRCCYVHFFASSDVPTSVSVFCLPQGVQHPGISSLSRKYSACPRANFTRASTETARQDGQLEVSQTLPPRKRACWLRPRPYGNNYSIF